MSLQNHRRPVSILALLFGAAIAAAAQPVAGRGEVVKTGGKQLKAHGGELRDLEVSPDGRVLASGGDDKTVKLWSLPGGELLHTLTGHTKLITDVEFTPDTRLVAAASEDRSISVWSVADGKRLAMLTGHTEWVSTVRFTPDGRLLVSQAANEWRTWSVPDAKPGTVRQIDGGRLAGSVMTPDGGTIAVGVAQGVALLSLPDLKEVEILDVGSVRALAITPDGHTLAAAGGDSIVLWSLGQRHRIGVAANVKGVNVLSITPDGRMLASGDASGVVRTWSLLDGRQVSVMTGHQGAVRALAISPDGRHVVSGSSDSTARLWSVSDGAPIAIFEGHRGSVNHVRISADGTTVITGQESDFQITGPTGGGIGMRKIKADAVIALWHLSPPAFRRYVGQGPARAARLDLQPRDPLDSCRSQLAGQPHACQVDLRTVGTLCRQANIALDRIGVRRREVADVHSVAVGRRADVDLHRRVADDEVADDLIAQGARRQDHDAVRIPHDHVVDDQVVVDAGTDDPDTEVIALGEVAISTEPVRTEPVAASGTGQSYAAARGTVISVSNRDVGFEIVVRRATGDDDPRKAVGRHRDLPDADAVASATDQNAVAAESLHHARPTDINALVADDPDSMFAAGLAATAPSRGIGAAGNGEPLQPQ